MKQDWLWAGLLKVGDMYMGVLYTILLELYAPVCVQYNRLSYMFDISYIIIKKFEGSESP
jgi:hypothetical protein